MKNNDFIIISTADWNSPIKTNKQYITLEIAKLGHRVLYIESLGIRKIQLKRKDFFRIIKRILKIFNFINRKKKNIWVLSPLLIPGATNNKIIFINKILFNLNLILAMNILRFNNDYLFTFNPITNLYLNIKKFKKSIYYAVDAIEYQPYMPKNLIKKEESILASTVDNIFVTSDAIFNKLKPFNKNISLYGNVCDFDHFSKARFIKYSEFPNDIKKIKKPIVGFIGSISEYKLNYDLIENVSKRLRDINFVFIGPCDDCLDKKKLERLSSFKNIYFMGFRNYDLLPNYCAYFDLAWMPIIHNKYTKSMFPLKFFEYLAAGLKVISTNVESIIEYKNIIYLSDNDNDIAINIERFIKDKKDKDLKLRLNIAKENTYEKRTKLMFNELNI